MAPPLRVISITEAVSSRQPAFVEQAVPFTVLFLSVLLLVLSVLRRSLERSAGKRSAAFARQSLWAEPSAFSVLRQWRNSVPPTSSEPCERSDSTLQKRLAPVPEETTEEEVFDELTNVEAQDHAASDDEAASAVETCQLAAMDAPEASAAAGYEVVEPPPGLHAVPAESADAGSDECPAEASWGCLESKLYGKSLLLAHREVSLCIPASPPGLTLPPGAGRRLEPGFSVRTILELQADAQAAKARSQKTSSKKTAAGPTKASGRRPVRRHDGGQPLQTKTIKTRTPSVV